MIFIILFHIGMAKSLQMSVAIPVVKAIEKAAMHITHLHKVSYVQEFLL